jgi:hypothetical protein
VVISRVLVANASDTTSSSKKSENHEIPRCRCHDTSLPELMLCLRCARPSTVRLGQVDPLYESPGGMHASGLPLLNAFGTNQNDLQCLSLQLNLHRH